jgi:prolipoprotein diacylglyceryltransferase
LIGLGLYTLYSGGNFWSLGDTLAIPAQFTLFGSWAGCWFDGCAYGTLANVDPILLGTDPFGSSVQRWPTQGMGVIFSVISFALLTWVGEQETPSGLRLALSLTLGAMSAAIISLYRSDPVLLLGPARLDTWGYALFTALGLAAMGNRRYAPPKT